VKTEIGDAEGLDAAPPPENARLVLDDGREITLARPVVNIGRRIDNHVVLDDTRVSRRHAQLRLRQGRYVLFDLGSSRGTTVNGQKVEECMLQKGDRVSFGGVEAVYLDDPAGPVRQDTKVHGDA
jgi:pSer/pThr/pTyr-binding forkhead associated (FHA) protein